LNVCTKGCSCCFTSHTLTDESPDAVTVRVGVTAMEKISDE
jgi:hypothetical protein